jgi:exopolysaccharide production protein ExoQ
MPLSQSKRLTNLLTIVRVAETGLTFLVLLCFTGFLDLRDKLSGGGGVESFTQGSSGQQIAYYGIYALTLILLAPWWQSSIMLALRDKTLWVLMTIALASTVWSGNPGITLRRSFALLLTTVFGVYLARRFSLKAQLRLLASCLSLAALVSLFLALALPRYGVYGTQGWCGIYSHKNSLGQFMCLSAVIFLILVLEGSIPSWIAWLGLGFSVSLLWQSHAKTALIVFVIIAVILPVYRGLRSHYILAVPWAIISIIVAGSTLLWTLDSLEPIMGAIGKDATFTGRTKIWELVIMEISQRPLLGYGYGAFWLGWGSESEEIWLTLYDWRGTLSHAHNGFLQLCLDLGLLGCWIFILGFVRNLLRAIAWLRSHKTAEGLWPLTYLTFLILFNLTESTLVTRNSLFWVLYVSVSFSILSGSQEAEVTQRGE